LRAVVEEQRHNDDTTISGKDQVYIALYIDQKGDGSSSSWKYVTSYLDKDRIFKQGHTGIRTDFIDAQFKDYQVIPSQSTVCI
jgi:hypothetical protein